MTPPAPEEWVSLARIRRPQGRKGEVFAEILTDFPEKFAERRELWLLDEKAFAQSPGHAGGQGKSEARPVVLKTHWLHKGGIVLHLEEVDSISDAEKLAGLLVVIPREQRVCLPDDEVYIADLVGCVVVDVANPEAPATIGEIQDVDRDAGPAPILIVRGSKGEVLIPFVKAYLRGIDLVARRVEMALPEGLVDLNA